MTKLQLLIFDCDGVLVDSEHLANRVIAEEISGLGFPMTTAESQALFTGGSFQDVITFIENKSGTPVPYDIESVYRRRTFDLFEKELKSVEGVEAFLKTTSLQKCVASNGPLKKMIFNLKLTNLYAHFEGNLFSAYEVNRWKPDPFLFLHAAETMGVAPESCMVIEDSIHGVNAAVAAGIPVLGYAPHDDGDVLAKAGAQVFSTMAELPRLIDGFEMD